MCSSCLMQFKHKLHGHVRLSFYNQHVLKSFGVHRRKNQPFSPVFVSTILLLFFVSLSSEVSSDARFFKGSCGLAIPDDGSTSLFTISNTSLIFGRFFGSLTKHLLAIIASFCTALREYFPSSLGSIMSRNFFRSDKCGFTHSKSFCSPLGRCRSIGRLPVMSS